jgi:hypothetical protein
MTMIFKSHTNTVTKLTKHDNAMIALDKQSNRILQYEDFNEDPVLELNSKIDK